MNTVGCRREFRILRGMLFAVTCSMGPMLGSCGGAGSNPSAVQRIEVDVYAERYRVRGYDENDPRLVRVLRELEALYQRPIAVRFAVDTMPRDSGFLEHLFNDELGKLPRVMGMWKRSRAKAFASMTAELRHIDFDYDGSKPETTTEYGKDPGRLRIVLHAWHLDEDVINRVMHGLHRRWVTRSYLEREPEQLATTDHEDYIEALWSVGASYYALKRPLPEAQREPEQGRSDVILRTLRLAQLVDPNDAALREALTKRLLEDGRYLRSCYESNPQFTHRVTSASPFFEAERSWTRWAKVQLEGADYTLRERLLGILLLPDRGSSRSNLNPRAFPTFDVVEQGFLMLRDWAKAGHPTNAGTRSEDPVARFFDRIVCTSAETARGFRTQRADNCRPDFYIAALLDPSHSARLLAATSRSDDPVLRREVTMNLLELASGRWSTKGADAVSAVLELWRQLEGAATKFTEMTRLLAIEIDHSTDLRVALHDRSVQYYRSRSAERGVLLFLLARIDGYGRTEVNWEQFAQIYGAPIDASQLRSYLEQGPLAFEELHQLWPALGKGWPSEVIAARVHDYLDVPAAANYDSTRAVVVRRIGSNIARYDTLAGLQKYRDVIRNYVGSDPGRERLLRDALESMDRDVERLQQDSGSRASKR